MATSTDRSTLANEYDLLTVREAAEIAQCSPQIIRRHIAAGELYTFKPCRNHLIPRKEFDAFMRRKAMSKSERLDCMVEQFVELAPDLSVGQKAKLVAAL